VHVVLALEAIESHAPRRAIALDDGGRIPFAVLVARLDQGARRGGHRHLLLLLLACVEAKTWACSLSEMNNEHNIMDQDCSRNVRVLPLPDG
jgi:hypothetical protein